MLRNLLVLLCIASLHASSSAQQPASPATPAWVRKADMPTARAGCRAVALGGKLYVIGGSAGFDDATTAFEMYDPAADRWTRLADLPRPFSFAGAAANNGKIYILNEDRLFSYDPTTNLWTERAKAPRAHRNFDMALCGGKLYALGGEAPAPGTKWGVQNLAALDVYDPAADKWQSKADMQIARHALPLACAAGKLYVLGGSFTFPDTYDRPIQVVEEYDPATDTWRTAGDLAFNAAYVPALEIGSKILVFSMGGDTPFTQEYDPAARKVALNWTVPSGKRHAQCAAVLDGRIYQAGGWTEPGKPVATLEVLELSTK